VSRAFDLALSVPAAIAVCAVLAAAGARLRALARLPLPPRLKLAVDFVLGAWGAGAAALACGLAGLFNPLALGIAAAALALCGRWRGQGWRWRRSLAVAAPALLLVPVALAPPFFYDALVYHLGLPWQALQEGRISPHPENLFAAFPPLAQMLYAFPISAGLDRLPALMHLGSFCAAAAALQALAVRAGARPGPALVAGAALPVLPALWLVAGLPGAEGWAVAAIIASLCSALSVREESGRSEGGARSRAAALFAGFLGGCASAARLQGIVWSAIALAIVAARSRRRARLAALAGAAWLLGSSPWWLKNLILLGDPPAPIGWRREGMQTLWEASGTRMHQWLDPGAALLPAVRQLLPHLFYLIPLALAAALAARSGGRRARILLAAAALGLAAWTLTGSLPRFLAPGLACLLALAAAADDRRAGRWAGRLALGLTLAAGSALAIREVGRLSGVRQLLGEESKALEALVVSNPIPAFAAARGLPAGARVLFVGEPRGYPFPRPFVATSQHDVSVLRDPVERLASAGEVRGWLLTKGYTHLLVNRAELARLAPLYPVLPWRTREGQERFRALLQLTAPPVLEIGPVGLFSLFTDPRDSGRLDSDPDHP
jgi:hypothetical protein